MRPTSINRSTSASRSAASNSPDTDGKAGRDGPQPLWGVADATATKAHLLALGAELLEDVHDVGDGIKVGAVLDPFGNRLGFIENPHFDRTKVR